MSDRRQPPPLPPPGAPRAIPDSPSLGEGLPHDVDSRNKIFLGIGAGTLVGVPFLLAVLVVLLAQRGCHVTGPDSDGMASASRNVGSDGAEGGHGRGSGLGSGHGSGTSGFGKDSSQGQQRNARGDADGDGRSEPPVSNAPDPTTGTGRDAQTDRARRSSYAVRNLPTAPTSPIVEPAGDREGGAGIGGGGGADFFGIKARGNKFVYVIDCSGSMQGPPFEKAADELFESLKRLRSSQQVFVILFDDREYPMFDPSVENRLFPATPGNIERINGWVRENLRGGGTDPKSALLLGLQFKPDVIFLLTDGGFSPTTVDVVTQQNKGRVVINTIGFINRSGEPNLQRIAQENRGKYRFVP